MGWMQFIIQTIIGWILEIPPDLLGRKVERFLDRGDERQARARQGHPRKHANRKRPRRRQSRVL